MKNATQEAGIPSGAVSKMFIGIPVAERDRVGAEEAARRLGYEVNPSARGLRADRTRTVALILPNLKDPFFAMVAHEICNALNAEGYRMITCITGFDAEAEQRMIRMAHQDRLDGIVAITCGPNLELDGDVPFVSIDRYINPTIPCISSDDFDSGFLAAEKLVALGCKRLVYFGSGSRVFGDVDSRLEGFLSCCRSKGVLCDVLCPEDGSSPECFKEYIRLHTTQGRPDFDGAFCTTDWLVIEVRGIMAGFGIQVPEQVQLIGFGGTRAFGDGKLLCSTIVRPVRLLAEACVGVLLNKDKAGISSRIYLPVLYAPGGTTREPYDSIT